MHGKNIRKVLKFGNSLGITIPNEIIEKKRIQHGDMMEIEENEKGELIVRPLPHKVEFPQNVHPEVVEMAYRVMKKYDRALRNLKDR